MYDFCDKIATRVHFKTHVTEPTYMCRASVKRIKEMFQLSRQMSLELVDLDKQPCPPAIFCPVQEIVTRLHSATTWQRLASTQDASRRPHELCMRNLLCPVNVAVISDYARRPWTGIAVQVLHYEISKSKSRLR